MPNIKLNYKDIKGIDMLKTRLFGNKIYVDIEVKIDKVFDTAVYPEYIERLMVTKKIFDNISDSLRYIQRSIFV